jgi:metal-responsive CopG/Arc/MetJ family transcriptional regulator
VESTIKTAVSLPKALFKRAEELAQEMTVSRSRLIALALQDYIKRKEQERYRASIDAAYGQGPDEEEQAWLDTAPLFIKESDAEDQW